MGKSMLEKLGKEATEAAAILRGLRTEQKNAGLQAVAKALCDRQEEILEANRLDIVQGKENHMNQGLLDRLLLTEERIAAMAEGILQIIRLEDPIGDVISMKRRPNGLMIGQKRVPLGVVGIIYEARPNVTADAFALCFKTGNAVILKGGSDALHSNIKIVEIIQDALQTAGITRNSVSLITDTARETTVAFMKMNQYIDVLIPRGSKGLIQATVNNSTIPVIETGTGNCHVYVDNNFNMDMALDIIENAKTQRISVCNACESLVVHSGIAETFIPKLVERLAPYHVEIRGDERAMLLDDSIVAATEEDWGMEYLDYILSLKIVDSFEEAVSHINHYNTGHSETIITESYEHANQFLEQIDAAAVYVNASTRFTDGFEFGFGAEIGISTQKLHARGPMGLLALTTTKYIIYGNGQIRK